jgi:D-3-phosphoglycerate dehydrogenase
MTLLKLYNISPKNFSKKAIKILKKNFFYKEIFSKKELIKNIFTCDILLTRIEYKIDKFILQKSRNLKVIATNTTGLNHIDIGEAKKRKIKLISLNDCKKELSKISASAEFTWCLLLAVVRKINSASNNVKSGGWSREKFMGIELQNKNIGIIGIGRNGSQIKRFAKSFKMKILCWDKFKKRKNNCSLDYLLKNSDFLVICIPGGKENFNFFNKEKLDKLKNNSIIINTSRGEILDELELLKKLKKKKILAAGLDVLQMKKDKIKNFLKIKKYLNKYDNLLITPHIAGVTTDSWEKSEIIISKKIVSYVKKNEKN